MIGIACAARRPDLWRLVLIAVVAASVRIVFFQNAPIFFEGDARGYLLRAVEISSGEGFQFSLKRTPGYPLLIAAVFSLTGPSLEAVSAVQHVFGIATALLVYGCARQIAGRTAGLAAGLATALSGSMLIYEHVMLTESLFTLLIVAAVWLALRGVSQRSWPALALAGAVASVGAMIRPVGLVLAIVIPMVTLGLLPRRESIKLGVVFLAVFGLVMSPWVLRNALVHGEAEVVHPGRFLIDRTIRHNPTGVSMYFAAHSSRTRHPASDRG
jgi:4-amino-4-deoxy-L-arabinose transferase-like glycosyltransferase